MVNGILAVLSCDIAGLINLGMSQRKLEALFQFENGLNSSLSLVKVYPDLCVVDNEYYLDCIVSTATGRNFSKFAFAS